MQKSKIKANDVAENTFEISAVLPVSIRKINGQAQPTISAEQLHKCLQIGRSFRAWFLGRQRELGIQAGEDYIVCVSRGSGDTAANYKQRHFLALTVALELCAHAANEQSPSIRQYLIGLMAKHEHRGRQEADNSIPISPHKELPKPRTPVKGRIVPAGDSTPAIPFELIQVTEGEIGGKPCLTVNARQLWQSLGVGRRFTSWIKWRLEMYEFQELIDFEIQDPNLALEITKRGTQDPNLDKTDNFHGGDRNSINYVLSLDTAKELAMIERTPQGRLVRRYFIDCERKMLTGQGGQTTQKRQLPKTDEELNKLVVDCGGLTVEEIQAIQRILKEKNEKINLLGIREYGRVLLLSRDFESSEQFLVAFKKRLSEQMASQISMDLEDLLKESVLKECLDKIKNWKPLNSYL